MNKNGKKYNDLNEKRTSVQSVHRVADILECVSSGFNSVTEIAAKCNLHKSTVHRLLKALGESNFVTQNPFTHKYYPGYRFVKLSLTPVTTHEFLIDCAKEEMLDLSGHTGETVDLRIKLGLRNIGLYLVQSKYDRIAVGDSLRNRPVNIGVDGRLLLSQLDDKEVLSTLMHIQMETSIKGESIDIDYILSELDVIRRQGYAVVHNELLKGMTCLCVPVKRYILPVVLSIVGPETRIRPNIHEFTKKLLNSSASISKYITEYQERLLLT